MSLCKGDIVNIIDVYNNKKYNKKYMILNIYECDKRLVLTYTSYKLIEFDTEEIIMDIKQWNHNNGYEWKVDKYDKTSLSWNEWLYYCYLFYRYL